MKGGSSGRAGGGSRDPAERRRGGGVVPAGLGVWEAAPGREGEPTWRRGR